MELQVKTRTVLGKRVRALRKAGFIPAEIFGHGVENRHVEVSEKDFSKLYKKAGEHTVITAATENGEKIPVLIAAIAREPLSGMILNIDLHQVRMDEKIQTKIPIVFTGEAPAVKKGLVLVKVMDEIEIESLPGKIPARFEIDLSVLEDVSQSIYVKDLKTPAAVKILSPENMAIVTITEKAKEEVEAPKPAAETVPAETAAAPETAAAAPATPTQKTKPAA